MPALTAIIGGDSRPLQREFQKVERMSRGLQQTMKPTAAIQWWQAAVSRGEGMAKEQAAAAAKASEEFARIVKPEELANIGKEATRAKMSVEGLGRAFNLLGDGAGNAIEMMVRGLKNPVMWAILAVIAALYALKKVIETLAPKEDKLGLKSLAAGMEALREKAIDAKASMATFFDEIKRGRSEVEKLDDKMKDALNTSAAWADADEKIAQAKKELALAEVEASSASETEKAKKKKEIENKFDEDKNARNKDRRDKEVRLAYDTADQAAKASEEAAKKVPGLTAAATTADSNKEANALRMQNAKDNISKLEKMRGDDPAEFNRRIGAAQILKYRGIYNQAAEQQADLVQASNKANSDLDEAKKDAGGLKKKAEDLRKEAGLKSVQAAAAQRAESETLELAKKKRDLEKGKTKVVTGELTDLQKVGAYTSPASFALVDVSRNIHREIKGLRQDIKGSATFRGHSFGKVQH